MPKISFILTSRDDNYEGCGLPGYTMKRLHITLASILALNVDSEIVVVEFCPAPEHGSLKEKLASWPVKVITLKRELLDLLHEDDKKTMLPFYEYLAKDYGFKKSAGEIVIFCNPDNIFPSINFDEVIADIEKGAIVTGVRNEIQRELSELDAPTLIDAANKGSFDVIGRYVTAAGDFTGMKREVYEFIGGYPLMHGNWHMDNLIIEKAILLGFTHSIPYSYYHLNHSDNCQGAEGRPKDWQNFKKISEKIVEGLDELAQI